MKEDRESSVAKLDVEAGCGEDRKKCLARRFNVKDYIGFGFVRWEFCEWGRW